MSEYSLEHRTPLDAEYIRLRAAAGLSAFSTEAVARALPGTVFAVLVMHGGQAVGMGRLIGDGGCFFQVVDIAVDPAHQGKGLGKTIMAAITAHIESALPAGAYVSLIADVPANRLYEHFGFRETAPRSLGMARRAG